MKKYNLADFQIPYGKQDISNEDIEAVKDVLNSDFITQGPKVSQFEESFSKYVGSKYAVERFKWYRCTSFVMSCFRCK